MFPRENYLNKIRGFYHDDGMIKVITGVRRCGKSCLMQCIAEELRAEGSFSIFITGLNSYLLSGELATKLTGCYIEFEMQTLDFGEYCQMKRFLGLPVSPNPVAEFDAYILEGGFPKAMDYPQLADKRAHVAAVIQEIFEKDIRRRVKIKNVSVFNQVRDYVINNFGATTSLANIQSDLEGKQGVKVKRETLARRVAGSASDASASWNATSSSGTPRRATRTFRLQ